MSAVPVTGILRRRLAPALIAAVAFFLRLLHALAYTPDPSGDMGVWADLATRGISFRSLLTAAGWAFPPGYPLFLKPFFLMMDAAAAIRGVQIAQAALGAITTLLVYRLARRLHSRRAGLAAAAITCLYAHFVFYSAALMSETLFTALYLGALLLALRAAASPSPRSLGLALAASAAAILVRPAAISLAPALLYAAWRVCDRPPGRATVLTLTVVGAAAPAAFLGSDPVGTLITALGWNLASFWDFWTPWPLGTSDALLFPGHHVFLLVSWRIVFTLGAAGCGVLLSARRSGAWVTPACLAAFVLLHLLTSANARLRLPVESLFLAWSGIACAAAARSLPIPRRARAPAREAAVVALLLLVLVQAVISAAAIRASLDRPESLLASIGEARLVGGKQASLTGDAPIPVDRVLGHYLQVDLVARQETPFGPRRNRGTIRLQFLDRTGSTLPWMDGAAFVLGPSRDDGASTPVTFRAHVPTQAHGCRLEYVPSGDPRGELEISYTRLRYSAGNDAALEFLLPYLRPAE